MIYAKLTVDLYVKVEHLITSTANKIVVGFTILPELGHSDLHFTQQRMGKGLTANLL